METKPAEAPEDSGGIVQQSGGKSRKNETGPSGMRSTLVVRTTWTGARLLGARNGSRAVRLRVSRLALHLKRGKAGAGPADEAQFGKTGSTAQQTGRPGSTIPLLSAEQGAGDQNSEQLSPDDILATSRRPQKGNQQQPDQQQPSDYALNQVAPFNDPALESYRQQNNSLLLPASSTDNHCCHTSLTTRNESEGLKRSSLVFVRNKTSATVSNAGQSKVSLRSSSGREARHCCRPAAGSWHDYRPPSVAP